jgi:thioredoxin reductase
MVTMRTEQIDAEGSTLRGTPETNVAIIGAGPYALSLATHLKARSIEHRIFGAPMQAWADMPVGMHLKSLGFATSIPVPQSGFDLPGYCMAQGVESVEPVALSDFIAYGRWVQRQLVPYVEEVDVASLSSRAGAFDITLSTGERVRARRVVNAVGLSYFARLPRSLVDLPTELVSHTAKRTDFSSFRGRQVVVLGAGQSALEAAALLHEQGARVEVYVRGSDVRFLGKTPEHRPLLTRLRYPGNVLGAGLKNWAMQHAPMIVRYVPEERRVWFTRTHLGPSGAWWLHDRVVGKVPMHTGFDLREAVPEGTGLRLRFVDSAGKTRTVRVEHLVAGTGYEVDVDRIPYLDAALVSSVNRIVRAPRLSGHFETSVPGLYFVGPSAAFSFGPLYRFVAGARYTSRLVSRRLQGG